VPQNTAEIHNRRNFMEIARNENVLAVDSIAPALAVLKKRRLCIDPMYAGECKRLFENAGVKINYFRRDGLTIDEAGEVLVDAGITVRRLDCREVLDLLDMLFAPRPRVKRGRAHGRKVVDEAERKARTMRNRKYECPSCKQKARGTRSSSLVCGVCYEMDGEIIFLLRVDALPEEVLPQAAGAMESAA